MNEDEKNFYEYMAAFQPDITKLVASKRKDWHIMSVDEIVSDFNYNTIKNKDKIINYRDERFSEFCFDSFKFVICSHIKNVISWYQSRKKQEKYFSRRLNLQHETEDGVKSSFEMIEMTHGESQESFFDDSQKHKYFLKLIKNYSEFLSKNEIILLSYMLEGMKQKDIADAMGVTHQAISFNVIKLEDKLKCRIKDNFIKDESWLSIKKGHESIENLFSYEKTRQV